MRQPNRRAVKVKYETPRLQTYGILQKLTKGVNDSVPDDDFTMTKQ
ncbi:MAG: hypothetical protein ACRDIB_06765 [Ardenticatenaceae bacterium]